MTKLTARLRVALVMVIAASALSPAPTAASTGWLDPTFSRDGLVFLTTDVPGPADRVAALALRAGPTGRVFLGRELRSEEETAVDVLALGSDGRPAEGFHDGAWATALYANGGSDLVGLHPTTDGGAVTALFDGWTAELKVHQYGPGGGLSRTRTFHMGGNQRIADSSLERLPGGSYRWCHDGEDDITRLIGLTASLDLDARVGVAGRRPLEISGCRGIAADASGHLYIATHRQVAETVESRVAIEILRTNNSGGTDEAWGDSGRVDIEHAGLRVTVAGPRSPTLWPVPGLGLDESPMIVLPDGSVLIAAGVARIETPDRLSAAVFRLRPDGSLDQAFGSSGMRAVAPSGGRSQIMAMAIDAGGRPILSLAYRYPDNSTRYWLARLTSTGEFDATFGNGGLIRQSYPVMSIDLDEAGRILTYARAPSGTTVAARRTP